MEQQANFGIFEVLAILGALAWLPQVFIWMRNYFSKPKLTIISGRSIEIGYTSLGPILNVDLAFLAENKKVLIRRIDVELTHEKNDTQKFSWDWFEETLYEANLPDFGYSSTRKNQKAIAINMDKDQLVEKRVGFQQNTFKNESQQLINLTTEEILNICNAQQDVASIKSQRSYNELRDLYKNSFSWKIGTYTVKFFVKLSKRDGFFTHSFDFKLSSLDIKALELNIEHCQLLVEKQFVDRELVLPENWKWINPPVTKKDEE